MVVRGERILGGVRGSVRGPGHGGRGDGTGDATSRAAPRSGGSDGPRSVRLGERSRAGRVVKEGSPGDVTDEEKDLEKEGNGGTDVERLV